MTKRQINCPEDEPEQKTFELPSEKEHLFQVVDKWTDKDDDNVILVKLEVADGEELGRSILHRVNLDSEWSGFFLTRLFLKAIGEKYKGDFETDDDMWIGRSFHATIIHNVSERNGKTYANIDKFNFDKEVEQPEMPEPVKQEEKPTMTPEEHQKAVDADQIAWDDD